MKNSDYIIYVDESGDTNLKKIDPQYPMFVLSFCIFHKNDYCSTVSPSIQRFKFKHFNHDNVVLHENEIRKPQGQFEFLLDAAKRGPFLEDLTQLIQAAPMTIIAAAIRKDEYIRRYASPADPYEIALKFCLERAYMFLKTMGQGDCQTHILVESRGKTENNALELAFRRIVDGGNYGHHQMRGFKLSFAAKGVNLGGMQLADLTARPIGLSVLRPGQTNRAFDVIRTKFRKGSKGIQGYGLKVVP